MDTFRVVRESEVVLRNQVICTKNQRLRKSMGKKEKQRTSDPEREKNLRTSL